MIVRQMAAFVQYRAEDILVHTCVLGEPLAKWAVRKISPIIARDYVRLVILPPAISFSGLAAVLT